MDISSPRTAPRPPVIAIKREAPSRPGELQSTYEDYDSSYDSGVESHRRRDMSNVTAKPSHPSDLGVQVNPARPIVKTVNFKQSDSDYSSHTKVLSASRSHALPSMESCDVEAPDVPQWPVWIAPTSNPVKSASTSSRNSKDSGYHSDRAEASMADIAIKNSHYRERAYNLSPRKPLQRFGSVSCKRTRERRKEKSEDCTDPNCTKCDLQADGAQRRRQSYIGARDSVVVVPAQSTRRPAVIVQQNPHMPAERYPPALGGLDQARYSEISKSNVSARKLEDHDKERERLRAEVRAERILKQEAQGRHGREHAERRLSREQEAKERELKNSKWKEKVGKEGESKRAERELRAHEGKDKAASKQKRQQNSSNDRMPPTPPMTDPTKEPQSLWTKRQKLSTDPIKEPQSLWTKRQKLFTDPIKEPQSPWTKRQKLFTDPIKEPQSPWTKRQKLFTDPIKEPQSPWTKRQKLSTAPPVPVTKADTGLGDPLGANTGPQSPKRMPVSVESPHSPASSFKIRECISKDLELKIYPQARSKFPMLLRETDSSLIDDRPLDVQRLQADISHYDVSTRLGSEISSSKSFPVKSPSSAGLSDDKIPGLERDSRDQGANRPAKLMKRPNDAKKLANASRPDRMGQTESPSFQLSTSAQTTESATRDGGHSVHEAMKGPAKELVLLSKPRKSDMPETSVAVDSSPISCLESSGDSSAGEAEEDEDYSFVEAAGESDEASEECEVNVKSALDTAMNVVKNLLLRELLDYALPDATDALEGSSSSRSGGAGSSASSSLSSSTSNSQTPQRRKRLRGNGRDPGNGDGDGDDSGDDDRPKKKSEKGSADRLPQRRLKCPFYQRQPEKYTKAACRGEGFADMAKLKDHIKRVHTQPLRCSRCWLEMKSEEAYSRHLQQEDICKKKAEPQEDRIRPQLLKRLDFKKAPYANARNVEEKWKMLFSVLFPSDTNIPSPCKSTLLTFHFFTLLMTTDEQQGMSPRLERALSEALEEELTRELAPIIEPIMTKIKGCIPAIIESCRQKLMSTSPSSGDETVFTPSATSSGIGSSDSEPGSSTKQARHRACPAASRCSGSSFEVVPTAKVLSNKAQGKRPQRPVASTSDVSINDRQEVSSPGSSTGYSMFYPDVPLSAHNLHGNTIGNSFDNSFTIEHETELYAFPGGFPSDSDPATESSSAVSVNTRGIVSEPYDFVDVLPQQNNPSLSGSQLPTWPLLGDGWDRGNITHGESGGEQQGGTIPQKLLPPQQWEVMMKDFDFSHLSNR